MNERVSYQLDKVLALADSDQEGEALGALRMARRILMREGLSFALLAQVAGRSYDSKVQKAFCTGTLHLEAKIDQLHDEIDAHVKQNQSLTEQIEFWRRRAFELEQLLSLNQSETTRWKDMARETAERLWDLGQIAQADAFLSPNAAMLDEEDESLVEPLKAAG